MGADARDGGEGGKGRSWKETDHSRRYDRVDYSTYTQRGLQIYSGSYFFEEPLSKSIARTRSNSSRSCFGEREKGLRNVPCLPLFARMNYPMHLPGRTMYSLCNDGIRKTKPRILKHMRSVNKLPHIRDERYCAARWSFMFALRKKGEYIYIFKPGYIHIKIIILDYMLAWYFKVLYD